MTTPPPPPLSYFTPTRLPWRQRPWNRWAKAAILLTILSALSSFIFLQYVAFWLVRPSTVMIVSLICEVILLTTFIISAIAVVSTSRHRDMQRGNLLAVFAFLLTLPSCVLFTMLHGPPIETPQLRFDIATTNNHKAVMHQLDAYLSTHNAYPSHLATLLASRSLTPQQLLDPFSRTTPIFLPPTLAPADWPTIVPDVDRHTDLIYTAADLPSEALDSDLILLYDKPVPERTGRVITFGDHATRFVHASDLPRLFAAHNAARASLGLPPHTLDVQPPVPVSATTPATPAR